MQARALSIVRPFVQEIIDGRKTVEIRSWPPPELPLVDLVLVENGVRLSKDGDEDPDGTIRAIVDVVGLHKWSAAEAQAAGMDWKPGYLCWEIQNIREVLSPIPCMAKRGIYSISVDGELLAAHCPKKP